jgi:hypothetical protein
MVRIREEGTFNISMETIIENCNDNELEELALLLVNNGYFKGVFINRNDRRMSPSEEIFEKELTKIHGNYSHLTKQETTSIINIGKKCVE